MISSPTRDSDILMFNNLNSDSWGVGKQGYRTVKKPLRILILIKKIKQYMITYKKLSNVWNKKCIPADRQIDTGYVNFMTIIWIPQIQ